MYRQIQDFLGSWAQETESTLKVFNAMTDESLAALMAAMPPPRRCQRPVETPCPFTPLSR